MGQIRYRPFTDSRLCRCHWQNGCMWDWDKEMFRVGRIADHSTLASFASGLIVNWPGGLDVNQSVLSRYDMRALPLVEWTLSPDAPALFDALKKAGATYGYFIDYAGGAEKLGQFRECDLSSEAARVIADEDLFGCATIFVDDQLLTVIAAWFSDFTHLCMSADLFDRYLSENPMFLDLHGDHQPPATTFQIALTDAFARFEQWSPSASEIVRRELGWQLRHPTRANDS